MDLIIDLIAIFILSAMHYLNLNINTDKTIYIPKGSISKIITNLSNQGLDINKIDALILRFIGSPQHGWIDLGSTSLTKEQFLHKIVTSKAKTLKITLIPSETTAIFFKIASKKLELSYEKMLFYFYKYSPIKEGFLVPNTYSFPKGITERKFILNLLTYANDYHKNLSFKIFGNFNKKEWFRYLTIASIIEKETASKEEMALISSVIYNRLKKGMKLQMDGALNYGLYSHKKVTKSRILNDKSRFNTYKHKGLPPYPITTVSKEAIRAAIFPKKTEFLYFVKQTSKKHKFSKTYKEHLKNIKAFLK